MEPWPPLRLASRLASPPSTNRRRSPSTPRRRRSRRPARTSSASAQASPTSRPRTPWSRPRSLRVSDPRYHHYSPTPGLPELREAIAFKTKRDSGVDCSAGQVVVTNGGKHAVYNTFQVLCNEGDEVLVPAPYWTSYPECITLAGGVPVVLAHHRGDRVPCDRRATRGGVVRRARRRCCSCRRATRRAPCTRPKPSRPSAAGRSSAASGS